MIRYEYLSDGEVSIYYKNQGREKVLGCPSIQMYVYTYHSYAQSPVVNATDTGIWTPERSHPRADDGALCNESSIIGARP